ncbi:hypothetical protein JAAARDRAFT_36349 [Jaapia argillacea MUCL 33604]|uniref:SCD domain-containing protein n=1 Tax=Jaapia argillacea MUCL 33604 TaxID=933084 RepID=A0A067PSR5_9AGAM|nr:hypothetical protein JAAARDRAFT_36349 [Jaapia argillacea MUCL 33604]
MSEAEEPVSSAPTRRRSQRDRKQVEKFGSQGKRKRSLSDTEGDDHDQDLHGEEDDDDPLTPLPPSPHSEIEEDEDEPPIPDADDEEEEYHASSTKPKKPKASKPKVAVAESGAESSTKPKTPAKPKGGGKGKGKAKETDKDGPPAKKRRTVAKPRVAKTAGIMKGIGRGKKAKAGAEAFDAEKVAKETGISGDNYLFNAILNPTTLQSTTESLLTSLSSHPPNSSSHATTEPQLALADLLTCIIRCCGCNETVDGDQVVDFDGVTDVLEGFVDGLGKESPSYPLISKLPPFKSFPHSLSAFIRLLITSSAELGLLYEDISIDSTASDQDQSSGITIIDTLVTWVGAMSSSKVRSFRHTATFVAMEVQAALCEVAAGVEREAEVVVRQKEGEKKRRKAKGKDGGDGGGKGKGKEGEREKELEERGKEVRERRTKLVEFLKEFVDGVFVHRYRDLDPHIRQTCVSALGTFFSLHPSHFLDSSYLRYIGWVLSDKAPGVRLAALGALEKAYEKSDYVGAMQHFTERFRARLGEMARGDIEVGVRVGAVKVLGMIDSYGLLDEERDDQDEEGGGEREELVKLVFDEEGKVRKAVGGFVRGVWEECVESRLVGRGKVGKEDRERAGVKALGLLLVRWGRALDRDNERGGEVESQGSNDGDSDGRERRGGRRGGKGGVAGMLDVNKKGRIALAVEALWDEIEAVGDWETLLDVLLLDHSASEPSGSGSGRKGKGRKEKGKDKDEGSVDDAWRLDEVEEGVLLEVLVASLGKAKEEVVGSKKGEEETVTSDISRALIKALPRLFVKHQTDENRIADVLLLPQLMNLDMYLEMRMITAYASLWDDVTKQFLSHSSPKVLTRAVSTIAHLMNATSLSNTNSTKILELEDELSTSLRDLVGGREELEVATFSEDEVLSLGALCTRIARLGGVRDLVGWMEEDEGGKQSSAWDIISAVAERGKLGYREEETMVDQAMRVLTTHIYWKTKNLTTADNPSPEEEAFREGLREQRDALVEKLLESAIGTQSNTMEGVKRTAFQNLINIHILFCPSQTLAADGSPLATAALPLTFDDEVQYRLAGFIQAEVERYAEELDDSGMSHKGKAGSDDGSDTEAEAEEQPKKNGKSSKRKKPTTDEADISSRSQLEREYAFLDVIATFLRAIRTGTLHVRHGAVLLAHHGRLGPTFDMCCKVIVEVLREEGLYNGKGEVVVAVVTQALRESFTLLLEGVVDTEEHVIGLAKILAPCFVMRGAQLAILRRLESQHVVEIHTSLLTWIGKRLGIYEVNKNKKGRNTAIIFFRALLPLLVNVESRDALKIKAHMDQALAQAKVEISATTKVWEPYRAYEKRLGSSMVKEKGKKKAQGKGAKSTEFVTTDDEDHEQGHESDGPPPAKAPNGVNRPAPRRSRRTNRADDFVSEPEDQEMQPVTDQHTPKARPRPRPAYVQKATPESPVRSQARSPSLSPIQSPATPSVTLPSATLPDDDEETNGVATPKLSRKRARSEDLDEPERGQTPAIEGGGSVPPSPHPACPPSDEIQVKRKRVRH